MGEDNNRRNHIRNIQENIQTSNSELQARATRANGKMYKNADSPILYILNLRKMDIHILKEEIAKIVGYLDFKRNSTECAAKNAIFNCK